MTAAPSAPLAAPPSARATWIAFLVISIAFVVIYLPSFNVLPAGDDFGYIEEIHRGNHDGVWALFRHSVTGQTYRPLTSVGIWAFGNIDIKHATQWIRVLHLLSAIGFAAVGLLWVRTVKFGWPGTIVALAMMLLHPILPSAVASIDGFNALASSAFLWLGAWFIYVDRGKPIRAIALALLSITLSVGFKEYGFALVPLAMLTVWRFWPTQRRATSAIVVAVVLGAIVLASIAVRRYTLPADAPGGVAYLDFRPAALLRNIGNNVVMLAGGLLFFGNSVWVYVNQSPAVLAIAGCSMIVAAGVIGFGVLLRARVDRGERNDRTAWPWIVFFLLSFVVASFPENVMRHVSEMYVPPILLPFAMLCAFAADALAFARPIAIRGLVAVLALVALTSSVITIRAKVAGVVDVGRRANDQVNQVLSFLPPDAHDMTVAIRYLRSDREPRDTYSVFRIPDTFLITHSNVLQWPLPYRNVKLAMDEVDSWDQVDPSKYDVTLRWDKRAQRFTPIARPEPQTK